MWQAQALDANKGLAFEGCKPSGGGFVLDDPKEVASLLARSEARYSEVVKPYLVSRDIAQDPNQRPTRWIIGFGMMELEEAMAYPAALDIVRERVKPSATR